METAASQVTDAQQIDEASTLFFCLILGGVFTEPDVALRSHHHLTSVKLFSSHCYFSTLKNLLFFLLFKQFLNSAVSVLQYHSCLWLCPFVFFTQYIILGNLIYHALVITLICSQNF